MQNTTINHAGDAAAPTGDDLRAVAGLLGQFWYVGSDTPGAAEVCWLELPGGGRAGVAPLPMADDILRWQVEVHDENGEPMHRDHTLPVDGSTPEQVAQHVRQYLASHGIRWTY